MKKILISLSLFLSVAAFYSCSEDSIQQKLEAEKATRVDYIDNHSGFSQTQTGLYYKITEEGTGETVLTLADAERKQGKYINVSVFMAFRRLDESVIMDNYLKGFYDPYVYTYYVSQLKQGLTEAFGMMKKGSKMRVVLSTSLYGTGLPILGIEPMYTREYESIICDIVLSDITKTTDPNLE